MSKNSKENTKLENEFSRYHPLNPLKKNSLTVRNIGKPHFLVLYFLCCFSSL